MRSTEPARAEPSLPSPLASLAARSACLLALAAIACSSPPPPAIPPREEIGPPLPAANECFPPYTRFAQDWFVLADLDLGVSCRVFLEQDECVLGIFDDCTDPSATSRQWVGRIDSAMMRDQLELHIFEGTGAVLGRPPKCCSGELVDMAWARLDCTLTADCGNPNDKVHVGAVLEAENDDGPFADVMQTEEFATTAMLLDVALLPARRELWAIGTNAIFVHPLGGTSITIGNVGAAKRLVVAPDEGTAFVADGSQLLRIDTAQREVTQTFDVGSAIQLLEFSNFGIVVGETAGNETTLALHRRGNISTVDAEGRLPKLAAIVEIPGGTPARAFVAAPVGGDLIVLTSSLTMTGPAVKLEKPARALFAVGTSIGFLAECSDRSTELHCWFELDPMGTIRRTGIPDIGPIMDAAWEESRDRMIFSGESGLGVLDRAEWRPLVQRRVPLAMGGPVATAGNDLYVLSPTGGAATRFTLR
jgi:hypothetical protein